MATGCLYTATDETTSLSRNIWDQLPGQEAPRLRRTGTEVMSSFYVSLSEEGCN